MGPWVPNGDGEATWSRWRGLRWSCNMEGTMMREPVRAAWWNLIGVVASEEGTQLSHRLLISVLLAIMALNKTGKQCIVKRRLVTQFPGWSNSVTYADWTCVPPSSCHDWMASISPIKGPQHMVVTPFMILAVVGDHWLHLWNSLEVAYFSYSAIILSFDHPGGHFGKTSAHSSRYLSVTKIMGSFPSICHWYAIIFVMACLLNVFQVIRVIIFTDAQIISSSVRWIYPFDTVLIVLVALFLLVWQSVPGSFCAFLLPNLELIISPSFLDYF